MNRLKELRLSKGLTLKQVADAIGVSEATVQRYETGKISSLKFETAEALAKLYNVSPGYLMNWTVQVDPDSTQFYPLDEEPPYYLDPEAAQLAQELFERPEMRVLFDASRNASKEDIEQVAALLEKLSQK